MTEQDIAMTIMQELVSAYDNFVQCLTINVDINDPDNIDLDEIINSKTFKKKKQFKNVKCYNCNKMGHYASDCKAPKLKKDKQPQTKNAHLNIKNNDEFIFHTKDSFNSEIKNIWLLDSGATNHLCCIKSMFIDLKPHSSKVKVGDGRDLEVMGIGNIKAKINSKNGLKSITIENVLYVPESSVNLISIG
ncbi:unnamed protein product [Brachionus calyciflorus]|uniref:CCHC-type domain-containing protein n=1 Tax=Brachionus calyciflorus TaxID=104777 RepID=A0A814G493_9BILA|nr:unnamed protein product [Brachionus calyciflorus]